MSSIAYVFPGQGAQAVGMGKAFYDQCAESREIYTRANAHLGFDLTAICFEGPHEALTNTDICQPALFVTSIAAVEAWRARFPHLTPVGCAGLSLGELTALAVAGAFSLTDGLYLVQARAAAMAECAAHHPGTMLAVIGLTRNALEPICRQSDTVMANINAPDQLVLSGTVPAIAQAEALVKAQGAKRAMRLDVAGAFHSPLMQPAADAFRKALAKVTINAPNYPVVSNVTAQPMRDPDAIRELLVKQIVSSVLWEPSMRWLIQQGTTTCVEFPPARILTGLLRRIDSSVKGIAVDEPADFDRVA